MRNKLKNLFIVLAFPLVTALIMEIICLVFGNKHLFTSVLDIRNLVRNSCISACIALALSFNISSGRFDLSLGAQKVAAAIIGGNIALQLGLGGAGILIFSVIFGVIFGTIVGVIFVNLRIPPKVLGIGMALIYECIAFASFNSQGLQIYGRSNVGVLSNMLFIIGVVVVAALIVLVLTKYTPFGYHHRAIQSSQKIAKNSGINVFRNAVICYTMAGSLVTISGVFEAAYKGSLDAGLGLTTTGTVMSNCFQLFLGNYIGKWCNAPIGIIVACFTIQIYSMGLGAFNMTTSMSTVVNITTFLAFLVYLANRNVLKEKKRVNDRIKEAKALRVTLGV